MDQSLDRNITTKSLLIFSLPSILSMVFMGIYSSVDGLFVARLVSTHALSSVNIVSPLIMVVLAIGFMLGAGGNALVARRLGEQKPQLARQTLTLLVITAFLVSGVLAIIGSIFIRPIMSLLGANADVLQYCLEYALPILAFCPFAMTGVMFGQFFITEGKATLSLILSVIGGIINMVLDYIFIAKLGWGISGAAIATGIGYSFPSLIGLLYFSFARKKGLYFVKPKFDLYAITKSASNGSSEMITMLASSVTIVLINNIMIRLSGADGIAAITIVFYVQSLLASIFMGYSSGIAPIISFNYGSQNHGRLKKIYRISLMLILIASVLSFAGSLLFAGPLVGIFTKPGTEVFQMSVSGFRIFAIGFLFMGFNGFSSAMFTALSDGKVSAILSFFRTLVFVVITTLTLPFVFGVTGIWIALPVAEVLALCMTIYYFKKMKSVYKYA